MGALFEIGKNVVKICVKNRLSEKNREAFMAIADTLEKLGVNSFDAREIERNFERISDKISKSCDNMLNSSSFDQSRKEVILQHILMAYNQANIGESIVFNDNLSSNEIEKILLKSNIEYLDDLNLDEIEYYKRLLNHTSCLIESTYKNLPEFTSNGISKLLEQIENIDSKIDEIIEIFNRINIYEKDQVTNIDIYNREYKQVILTKYSYISLFGASSLESKYKKYRLSISYVELELCKDGVEFEEYISPEKMIFTANNKIIWIIGEAGSGKTTLLQWFATTVASNSEKIKGTKTLIPIIIELRKYANEKITIKKIIDNIMENSSYHMPEGWIESNIELGRFLFLVDGFDEVDSSKRIELFDLLEEIDLKNKCKKIFTARPTVKERPNSTEVSEYHVLPMRKLRIKQFIKYWHKAVLEEQLEVGLEKSNSISDELYEKIVNSDSLLKLAAYPLLCAMICALHYRSEGNLPANKREIYEECCKMLLENRDKERSVFLNPSLTYEKKKTILSVLSFWMMRNNYIVASRESVNAIIEPLLTGMDIVDEVNVLDYLIERCGILREPEFNKIDFIHRTFQEYLTANEINRSGEWGFLITKLDDESWQETITIAIGYSNEEISNSIISKTIDIGKQKNEERKYLFIATKYLSGAITVDKNIRNNIEIKLKEIVPPNNFEECSSLSFSGDLLTPYLCNKKEYSNNERLNCLRTLQLIGTEKSLRVSKTFLKEQLGLDEAIEIGEIISQFEDGMLIENEIPEAVLTYLMHFSKVIFVHEAFLRALRIIKNKKPMTLNSNTIWLTNYMENVLDDDSISYDYADLFNQVETLIVDGYFDCLKILDNFRNLKKLVIISANENYSIYELNQHSIFDNLLEFSIISQADDFINGKDLCFLKNCKVLNLCLMGRKSEFSLEYFYELNNLESLSIASPFVYDFDYRVKGDNKISINRKEIDYSNEDIDEIKRDYLNELI